MTSGEPAPERSTTRSAVVIATLALVGMGACAVLLLHHEGASLGNRFVRALCGSGSGSSCDLVNRSELSRVLGVPLAQWGFVFYGAIAALATVAALPGGSGAVAWIRRAAAAGFAVDVALFLYSLLGLGAVCLLCSATYAITLAIALVAWVGSRLCGAANRVTFADPRLATVALLGFVAATCAGFAVAASARLSVRIAMTPDQALSQAWTAFHRSYLDGVPSRIDVEGSARRGAERPVLSFVMFADFMCPHCRRSIDALASFVDRHRDAAQLVFKHYPLDDASRPEAGRAHVGASLLARAAEAAALQGRFWMLQDLLFANQALWTSGVSRTQLVSLAAGAGLRADRFEADLDSADVASAVRRDVEEGERLGVTGTPTLFVNGRLVESLPIAEFLEELLREETLRTRPVRPPVSVGTAGRR